MIKKIAIILLCGVTSIFSAEKLEFMKNGPTWRANMTVQEKLSFMRNKGQISHQIIDLTQEETNVTETKPFEKETEAPLQEPTVIIENYPLNKENLTQNLPLNKGSLDEDDLLTENELINYAIKLSLDDTPPLNNKEPSNHNQPTFNETIQKIVKVPGNNKNIIINYNVTIHQKLKNSSQNINIGKKNSNS